MHIAWASLGEVFLVSFGTAVGVVVLFSLGVAVSAPQGGDVTGRAAEVPRGARLTVAVLCFLACALVVGYGLYLIVAG